MELNKIIRKIVDDKISGIHTCLPGKIESYDPLKMRAKVTLLAKKELAGEMVNIPPIVEVPVALLKAGPFIIRQPFQKGDPVLVVFGEKAIDKLLITGNPEDPQLKREHSYDDAIVIGGLQLEQDPDLPNEELNSLYIANTDKDVKLFINPDGTFRLANDAKQFEIVIESNGICRIKDMKNGTELKFDTALTGDVIFTLANKLFLGSAIASEGAALGTSLKAWLDGHTHPGGSGGTTGAPTSASTPPSSKVMVE